MSGDFPHDPLLDPVGIVVWAVHSGIYDMMYSSWGWPLAEIVHFFGICLLIGAVGMFDLTMLGLVRGIPLSALHKLVPFGVLGFALSVASGFCFVVSAPDQYLYNPAWHVKMYFLAAAGVNMALFYLTTYPRVKALISGPSMPLAARLFAGVSLTCWLVVIMAGRVITAFRPPGWFWCGWCS